MLHWVSVDNFRSCSGVRVDLDEPMVALVGKNGVGKTNLLHAIHLACRLCVGAAEWGELQPVEPDRPARMELEFTAEGDRFRYAAMHAGSHESRAVREELARVRSDVEPIFRRQGERIEVAGRRMPVAVGKATSAAPAMLQLFPGNEPLSETLRPVFELLRGVRYYRLSERAPDEAPARPFISQAQLEEWMDLDPVARRRSDSIALRLIDLHENRKDDFAELSTILDQRGLGLISRIGISQGRISDNGSEGAVAYQIGFVPGGDLAGAGRSFSYGDLSIGTRRVVQLLTHLIYDRSAVMLLEQPEDSIHAGLVQKLIDILRTYSDRSQVVLSTHSARIVDLLNPESIRLVSATEGRTAVQDFDDAEVRRITGYLHDEGTLSEYLETL